MFTVRITIEDAMVPVSDVAFDFDTLEEAQETAGSAEYFIQMRMFSLGQPKGHPEH